MFRSSRESSYSVYHEGGKGEARFAFESVLFFAIAINFEPLARLKFSNSLSRLFAQYKGYIADD